MSELDLINQANVISFFEIEKLEYVILIAAKVGEIVANNTHRRQFIYANNYGEYRQANEKIFVE